MAGADCVFGALLREVRAVADRATWTLFARRPLEESFDGGAMCRPAANPLKTFAFM